MSLATARNIAIIVGLAAIVTFVPGGGNVAALIGATLSVLFFVGLAWFAVRMYLENRDRLFMLEDTNRALLYGAAGVVLVTLTATSRLFETSGGTLAWFVLMIGSGFAVYRVYRTSREY